MSKVERGAAAWQRFRCLPLLSCPHPARPRQPPEDLSQDLPSRGLFPKRLIGVTVLAGTLCALLLQPQQLLAVGIPCSSPGRCVQGARAAPEHSQRPECRLQPQTAPAAGPTATHAASRTQQEGKQLRAQLFPLSGSRKAAILTPQCLPGALPCSPSLLAEAASVSVFLMAGAGGEDPKMTRTCLELLGLGNSAGQCPAVTQARPCLPADVSCNGKLLDRVCRGRREGSEERPG